MARLLHNGHHHDDDCGCDHSGLSPEVSGVCEDENGRRRRRRRRERLIPVNQISIDCTPVAFRTPGQAKNVVSCAVDEVLSVPITRTTIVQQPTGFGCFQCIPVTETVAVPVMTTVNVPPTLVPVPTTVCPPGVVQSISPISPISPCGCSTC